MVSCVYVETEVRQHPRTLQLLERLHKLPLVKIGHYGEEPLFAQNMDLNNGIISYPLARAQKMIQFCEPQLRQQFPLQNNHPCEWHD